MGSQPNPPEPRGSGAIAPPTSPRKTRTEFPRPGETPGGPDAGGSMKAIATAQTARAERSSSESILKIPSFPTDARNHFVSAPGRPFQASTTSPESSTRMGESGAPKTSRAAAAFTAATCATSRSCISGRSKAMLLSSTPRISAASRALL
jgi:hypothetical protein